MKKIMNIQKHTKFMIFLHEKEAFLQKISKDLLLFQILRRIRQYSIFCNLNFWNFCQVVCHFGSAILNFANLMTD